MLKPSVCCCFFLRFPISVSHPPPSSLLPPESFGSLLSVLSSAWSSPSRGYSLSGLSLSPPSLSPPSSSSSAGGGESVSPSPSVGGSLSEGGGGGEGGEGGGGDQPT